MHLVVVDAIGKILLGALFHFRDSLFILVNQTAVDLETRGI